MKKGCAYAFAFKCTSKSLCMHDCLSNLNRSQESFPTWLSASFFILRKINHDNPVRMTIACLLHIVSWAMLFEQQYVNAHSYTDWLTLLQQYSISCFVCFLLTELPLFNLRSKISQWKTWTLASSVRRFPRISSIKDSNACAQCNLLITSCSSFIGLYKLGFQFCSIAGLFALLLYSWKSE